MRKHYDDKMGMAGCTLNYYHSSIDGLEEQARSRVFLQRVDGLSGLLRAQQEQTTPTSGLGASDDADDEIDQPGADRNEASGNQSAIPRTISIFG
jgi:hypothetical protein